MEEQTSRWTAGQVALVAAVGILAVLVALTFLGQTNVIPGSLAAAISTGFLGVCGLAAGLFGLRERRRGRWPEAATAYRVAMWCFFLAAVHVARYHAAAEDEALKERIREASDFQEKLRRLKEQQTNREP